MKNIRNNKQLNNILYKILFIFFNKFTTKRFMFVSNNYKYFFPIHNVAKIF